MQRFTEYLNNPRVVYGGLLPEDNAKIKEDNKIICYFRKTGLMKQFENMKYPSDRETFHEIMQLKQIMEDATDEDILFANKAETDEFLMYNNLVKSLGLNLPQTFIPNIIEQTDPILFYLKKHHDRARPEQFAAVHNIPFQTMANCALNPAYPSGHALDSYTIEHVLCELSPSNADRIKTFTCKMRTSRLHGGVHYPSDNEISKHLANAIVKNNLLEY